jgi:hypothetical protein
MMTVAAPGFVAGSGWIRFVVSFMVIWFSVLLLGVGTLAIGEMGSLLRGRAPTHEWMIIISVAFMLAVGVALVGVGRLLAHDEDRFLLGFLRDAIAAQDTGAAQLHTPMIIRIRRPKHSCKRDR